MKKNTILMMLLMTSIAIGAQSVINITTSGGSYPTEKWVNITTEANNGGTQIWGQGDGTQCDEAGLINEDIPLPAGTYYVNCFDKYDDGWDGTTIVVTAYGIVIGNNGGTSPDDGEDTDMTSSCEGTNEELEASFVIVVTELPSCFGPTSLEASNITTDSADVAWIANNGETEWEYVLQPQGTGEPTAAGTSTTTNPLSLTNLSANTRYEVYLRAMCGSDSSSWAGPLEFTTACDVIYGAWENDFEDNADCWTFLNGGSNGTWEYDSESGNLIIEYDSNVAHDDYAISPAFKVNAGESDRFSLDAENRSTFYEEVFDVQVWNQDYSQLLETLAEDVLPPGDYETYTYDLSAYTDEIIRVAFHITTLDESALLIDNVIVDTTPSCLAPTDVEATNITSESVELSWVANNDNQTWIVEYGLQGFVQGSGEDSVLVPLPAGTLNSYTFNNLNDDTAFDFYIKADCGNMDTSSWMGPVTVTTLPAPVVPNYTNDFSEFPGNNWREAGSGTITEGPGSSSFGDWSSATFLNGSDGNSGAKINLYYNDDSEWLISNEFDLSGGSYYLNLDAGVTDWNNSSEDSMGSDDVVSVVISTDSGLSWTVLHQWDVTNQPSNEGVAMPEINLVNYTGVVMFAIHATDGSVADSEDYDFHIDNFRITDSSLSIKDLSTAEFTYFPNPVNNQLNIKAKTTVDQVEVYNMLGQTVIQIHPNSSQSTVDMSALSPGAYFVKVAIGSTFDTIKVLKN
jgi:hypothetical protein